MHTAYTRHNLIKLFILSFRDHLASDFQLNQLGHAAQALGPERQQACLHSAADPSTCSAHAAAAWQLRVQPDGLPLWLLSKPGGAGCQLQRHTA